MPLRCIWLEVSRAATLIISPIVMSVHPSSAASGARVVLVPELTALAGVKLNERRSLPRRKDRILITALKTGFDFYDQILNLPWYETND